MTQHMGTILSIAAALLIAMSALMLLFSVVIVNETQRGPLWDSHLMFIVGWSFGALAMLGLMRFL